MINSVFCNTCNELMGIVMDPNKKIGTTTGNIPIESTYHCARCKHSIVIKEVSTGGAGGAW